VAWRGGFPATCSVAERQSPQVDERDARARRDPATYQPFQHVITNAPSSAEGVWRYLRATIPERSGVWILYGTSGPTQGRRSVAVARQYCGTWPSPGITAG
jgi:SRSO17 transposase